MEKTKKKKGLLIVKLIIFATILILLTAFKHEINSILWLIGLWMNFFFIMIVVLKNYENKKTKNDK